MGLWAVSKSQGVKGYQEPRFPYVPLLPSDWKLPTPTRPPRNLDNPLWDHKKHNPYSNPSSNPPEQTFIQICHSAGAIYTRNALRYTESSIRQRILVLAVPPGAFIRRKLCGYAIHLVNQDPASGVADWLIASAKAMLMPGQSHPKLGFDLVPYFDAPGAQACRESIIVIKSHPDAEWYDHSIDSPTYRSEIHAQFRVLCSLRRGGESSSSLSACYLWSG